jgi:hypothetical protein
VVRSDRDVGVVPVTWMEVGHEGDLGFVCGEENVALLFDREVHAREAWLFRGLGAIRRRLSRLRTISDPFSTYG